MKKIYLISTLINDKKIYKIGYTKREVIQRIKELSTANPYVFEIEKVYLSKKYTSSIENYLHRYFKDKKIKGEWFELNEKDISEFESLCDKSYNIFKVLSEENTYLIDNGKTFN